MAADDHTPETLPAELTTAWQDRLLGFIRQRVGSEETAKDLTQEVWYSYRLQLQRSPVREVGPWLYRVARNKIIDHYRRVAPERLEAYLFDPDGDSPFNTAETLLVDYDTPEDTYWRNAFWEALYEALDALPKAQRLVFVQNELEGRTLREIAEVEAVPLKTIISRKGYARNNLRTYLQDFYDDLLDQY